MLFRRWTAPRATHFYLFCLVSFALYALKYTGKLDGLDWTVFWTNVVAEALQPALFLHFALSFPEERLKNIRRRWLLPLGLRAWRRPARAVALVDRYAGSDGAAARTGWTRPPRLRRHLLRAGGPPVPAQLPPRRHAAAAPAVEVAHARHAAGGAAVHAAFTPFRSCFDLSPPQLLTKLAGLSLVFLPLTFSWAIVRYRLMDTDLIFKRGVAYTLATGLILGGYFGDHRADRGDWCTSACRRRCGSGRWSLAILVTAAVFDPLKRRIQGWVDRVFDRHRYDYRKALVEFGRGLSSETDLEALLKSIVERLPRTLLVARVAVFLAQDSGRLRLAASHGLPAEVSAARMSKSGSGLPGLSTGPATIRTSSSRTRSRRCICRSTSSAPRRCST